MFDKDPLSALEAMSAAQQLAFAPLAFQATAVMQARSLRRDAFPDDVEGTVVFLASDDSAFMSGQTLIVDGGSVFSTL